MHHFCIHGYDNGHGNTVFLSIIIMHVFVSQGSTNRVLSHLQPPFSDKFSFRGFKVYLMTAAGGKRNRETANSIISDVTEFFSVTPQSSKQAFTSTERLLSRYNLELFINYIKNEKKSTALTKTLRRLTLAIQYIIDLSNRKDHYIRGRSLLKLLADLRFSQLKKSRGNSLNQSCIESTHNEEIKMVSLYMINVAVLISENVCMNM